MRVSVLANDAPRLNAMRLAQGRSFWGINGRNRALSSMSSPPEQLKIAHILTTVDDLIDRTETLIAKLRAIKQGLMHDLLTRGVDEHGQLRPPREEAPQLYRELAVGWVPREWEAKTINSLVNGSPMAFQSNAHDEEGPWMVTALDIANGQIQYATAQTHLTQRSQAANGKEQTPSRRCSHHQRWNSRQIAIVDRDDICINQSVASLHPWSDTDTDLSSTT